MNDVNRSAEFSECGQYRWSLKRSWEHGENGRFICFVMLNPSTADALVDDPTIRRCIGFARRDGFNVLVVRNLFALRATDPKQLRKANYPTGGRCGDSWLRAAAGADLLVAAWGANVPFHRDREAMRMFRGKTVYCLGRTKNGNPRHPLYVRADQPFEVFHSDKQPETRVPRCT